MSVAHLAQRRWEVWPLRYCSGTMEGPLLSVEEAVDAVESELSWRLRKGMEGRRKMGKRAERGVRENIAEGWNEERDGDVRAGKQCAVREMLGGSLGSTSHASSSIRWGQTRPNVIVSEDKFSCLLEYEKCEVGIGCGGSCT